MAWNTESIKDFIRRLPVITLIVIFGTGSWVAINGMWVELPLLVALNIPEGYNLASYLVIIIQLANVGPLAFTLANWWAPKGIKIEAPAICILMVIGITSTLLMVFFWDTTTVWKIDDSLHSTALLCLAFFLSIVDCTSSVAFTPFMARFKNMYLTWYFVGEGFSALLPSLVALIQGVGSDTCIANYTYVEIVQYDNNETYERNCTDWMQVPKDANFPPDDFFWFLFSMMVCSALAFLGLNVLPIAKKEYAQLEATEVYKEDIKSDSVSPKSSTSNSDESISMLERSKDHTGNHGAVESTTPYNSEHKLVEVDIQTATRLSRNQFIYLYVVLGFVNALSNGILASIQSYSAGAYGLNTYLLAATLANVANPVACFLVMAAPSMSLGLVGVLTCLGSMAGSYCLAMAVLSPTPPLQFEMIGSVLIVLAWVLTSGILTYIKATIGWILRNQQDNRTLLIWYGGVTQIGSLIGAFIMFPLVNVLYLFQGYYEDACADFEKCEGSSIAPTLIPYH